jgi:fibrillarin-like pre-rRNA processing protein
MLFTLRKWAKAELRTTHSKSSRAIDMESRKDLLAISRWKSVPRIRPSETRHVYTDGTSIYTLNLVPGQAIYGERLVAQDESEYRVWNPRKSKLSALILKGCKSFPFTGTSTVLYLGAASGTTASHLSDICVQGMIYCVEISPRPFRKLMSVSENRENMLPLLADANRPKHYQRIVGKADVLYQDVAQRNQAEILLRNLELVKEEGFAFLMIKARSIDVTQRPDKIYRDTEERLSSSGVRIMQRTNLEPYEKNHAAFVIQK